MAGRGWGACTFCSRTRDGCLCLCLCCFYVLLIFGCVIFAGAVWRKASRCASLWPARLVAAFCAWQAGAQQKRRRAAPPLVRVHVRTCVHDAFGEVFRSGVEHMAHRQLFRATSAAGLFEGRRERKIPWTGEGGATAACVVVACAGGGETRSVSGMVTYLPVRRRRCWVVKFLSFIVCAARILARTLARPSLQL